mgnify:CR=1 FL=1
MTDVAADEAIVEVPPKLLPVFSPPRGAVRYRWAYGGRGSGKSRSFALMAAVYGYATPLRILCTREFQASIRESFHQEVADAIAQYPWLAAHYEVGESFIRGANGTEFLFRGLRRNMQSIKSTAGIDLVIVEEAEDVPERSWVELEPTIRAPDSEIWVIWNPRDRESPVNKRFVESPPANGVGAFLVADDNPWLPDVLRTQMQNDRVRMNPETYAHVWDGAYLDVGDAQVLHGRWRVESFDDPQGMDVTGPYYGADWGFSSDPTTLVRFFVGSDTVYITHEAYRVGCEIVDTSALFRQVPESELHTIRADNARPEVISHMRNEGWKIQAADKWPGSVEDGVSWLRGYQVVIHERCFNAIREARLWSYKTDPRTGDPMPKLADGNDHIWDAVRYAAAPMIRATRKGPSVRSL